MERRLLFRSYYKILSKKTLLGSIFLLLFIFCDAQQSFTCNQEGFFFGIIRAVIVKDNIDGKKRLNYYLVFNEPINMLAGDGLDCDTALGITQTTLLPDENISLSQFKDKYVTVQGIISLTPTMHYHTQTMISDIKKITLESFDETEIPIFFIGDKISPTNDKFELLGISSSTSVYTYKYRKRVLLRMFERQISDILVNVKNGYIVTTIYNLIPEKDDVGVPRSIVDLVQKNLPYPLTYINGLYGINIDDNTITLSRTKNPLTFNQDRIMFYSSVKNNILSR